MHFRPQIASSMFLAHNTELVPPYRVLIDTNFINFSLQNKLELVSGMMDCLFANCLWSCRNCRVSVDSNIDRHTLCHGLCYGWIGEARPPVSYSTSVRQYLSCCWRIRLRFPSVLLEIHDSSDWTAATLERTQMTAWCSVSPLTSAILSPLAIKNFGGVYDRFLAYR